MSFRSNLNRRLNECHSVQKLCVIGLAVHPMMNSAMAVRAKRNNETRIIRAAITQSAQVVWLQIRSAVSAHEWSWTLAPLAPAVPTGHDIVPHCSASFDRGSLYRAAIGGEVRRSKSSGPHECEVRVSDGFRLAYSLCYSIQGTKLKNDCITKIALSVRCTFDVVCLVDQLIDESETASLLPEEKKVFATLGMSRDRFVPAEHLHITDLSFTEIFERTIISPTVGIAVLQALFSCNDDHQGVSGWCDYASLLLTPKSCVNVTPAVVDAVALITPRHLWILPSLPISEREQAIGISVNGLVLGRAIG
uniref:Uncharacterized protein n=2 Tax=Phyllobacteriaceae TaxID=69277 RepID=Q11J26_CHESB